MKLQNIITVGSQSDIQISQQRDTMLWSISCDVIAAMLEGIHFLSSEK